MFAVCVFCFVIDPFFVLFPSAENCLCYLFNRFVLCAFVLSTCFLVFDCLRCLFFTC